MKYWMIINLKNWSFTISIWFTFYWLGDKKTKNITNKVVFKIFKFESTFIMIWKLDQFNQFLFK